MKKNLSSLFLKTGFLTLLLCFGAINCGGDSNTDSPDNPNSGTNTGGDDDSGSNGGSDNTGGTTDGGTTETVFSGNTVAVAMDYACAIKANAPAGETNVVCWGEGDSRLGASTTILDVPEGLRLKEISARSHHACGLLENTPTGNSSNVVCWGNSTSGTMPPANTQLKHIASGLDFSCGLLANTPPAGTTNVVCWGSSFDGKTTPPAELQFSQIILGSNHACGLISELTDGSTNLRCWGYFPSTPSSLDNQQFSSIGAGNNIVCGVFSNPADGNFADCWHHDASDPSWEISPPEGLQLAQVGGGTYLGCGLKAQTTAGESNAVCWGPEDIRDSITPPEGKQFKNLTFGPYNTCGILKETPADGSSNLICWGYGNDGQNDVPSNLIVLDPSQN